jgi:hypothetical protein
MLPLQKIVGLKLAVEKPWSSLDLSEWDVKAM